MHPLFEKYGLTHLSISQIKTIKRSPFVWICEKVLGRVSPSTEATAFGTFVHENFERWSIGKIDVPTEVYISPLVEPFHVDTWDEKALKFWKDFKEQSPEWPKEEDLECEFTIELDSRLPPVRGMIDVVIRDGDMLNVQDHKTIGNKKFAPATPEDLSKDPQLNLYAYAMLKDEKIIRLQHNQLFKKIKRKPVNVLSVDVTPSDVKKAVKGIVSDGLEAIKILEQYDELGIEGFAHAVDKEYQDTRWDFGGCPHWGFHQDCLKKHRQGNILVATIGEEGMPVNLHELVGTARDYFIKEGLTKFDLADEVVAAVMNRLTDKEVKSVFIRDGECNSLIYNQLLNQIAEKGIVTFKKII